MAEAGRDDDDRLGSEARAWLVRLTSGEATDADAWQFGVWRQQSPRHEAAYRDATRLWRALAPVAHGQMLLDRAARGRRVRRRALIGTAAAAAAAGAALVIGGQRLQRVPSLGALMAQYRTGTGEQRRVTLEDGSVVEMNTRTSLTARFSDAERRLDLVEGEALFTVRPESGRPFVVSAAGGETRALGTVFDVRIGDAAVQVTCLSGRVAVERLQHVELWPGQQVTYSSQGLGDIVTVTPDLVDGWRRGVLVFRDAPLREVVAELNRYRPGLIVLIGGVETERHVSGVFHLDRLDEVLAQIERIGHVQAMSLPGRIILLRRTG
ncbi:FecR family protein [Rhodopila sp.]|uniref:FecR family protein n=1 Tax=Rhodopila sp. TaxID=2480087 RepID=UPI002BB6FDBC|nr:FecR family protein [Rhodopila sp.]HVZ07813.1 FecR family protein [Rhodopila sp.]